MKRDFSLLSRQKFDLLVCGGGIYGAWVAYDATLRGLRVAIVDQGDWGGATSSASSKLIHGGLRYLESMDLTLVRKTLQERQMLLSIAPHRVWPLHFGVPVFKESRLGRHKLRLGLTLYDWLCPSLSKDQHSQSCDTATFCSRFRMMKRDQLQAGFMYDDAQTDDARLVLELIAGAQAIGAVCVNYCQVEQICEQEGLATGARLRDMLTQQTVTVQVPQLVNACGQWHILSQQSRLWCRLTRGVHLILPDIHLQDALLLTSPADGRVVFVIPWYGRTLVGTTDTDFFGDINHVTVETEDVEYLLEACNAYLQVNWKSRDVIGCFAGLRVLQASGLLSPSASTREWELKTGDNGVHYSIGGKMTSAREDAAQIVSLVCDQMQLDIPCATGVHPLPWAPDIEFLQWQQQVADRAAALNVDEESTLWLMRRHGKRVHAVLDYIRHNHNYAERIVPEVPLIYADLYYCARHEMVMTLEDLLRRRLPLMIVARFEMRLLRRLARITADIFGWDEVKTQMEMDQCCDKWLQSTDVNRA